LDLKKICRQILDVNSSIIIVQISTSDGKLLAAEQRQKFPAKFPVLSPEELQVLTVQSLIGININKTQQAKFGLPLFSFTRYEAISRLTMIWQKKMKKTEEIVIILTMEKSANPWELELELINIIQETI
jgi:predicted component of type VI protein secretion system